ncbi:hypothetical protein OPAG_08120 [Rhodococcus opacus PD630]|nr:hypothetical protein Pd630_LPD09077 [Rhodococcus opacus PD630]EHI41300.1 hypothetical protein OPAG_08120 [Rhodococcus opacus PD630]
MSCAHNAYPDTHLGTTESSACSVGDEPRVRLEIRGCDRYDRDMETQPLDDVFAALDAQIRQQAEQKMKTIRGVASAHRTLTAAREDFARTDAENSRALGAALAEAKAAGFTDAELKEWRADDEPKRAARKPGPRRTKRATNDTRNTAETGEPALKAVSNT